MLPAAAFICFAVALIFHVAGGTVGKYWVDAELAGFIFLAWSMLAGAGWPTRKG